MPKIVIPKGEYCGCCKFIDTDAYESCNAHDAQLEYVEIDDDGDLKKCQQCLNKEQIIIQYGEADENKKNIN